jgi:hypothetical protein
MPLSTEAWADSRVQRRLTTFGRLSASTTPARTVAAEIDMVKELTF